MSKKLTLKSPTEYIYYKKLQLPRRFENEPAFIKKLRKNVSIQAQGDAIELSENVDLPTLMVTLDVVRKFSPEVVFTLQSGEKILLFDHQADTVIRPDDVNTEFVSKGVIWKRPPKRSLEIDIESEWKLVSEKDRIHRLRLSLKGIEKKLTNNQVTTLVGMQPKALFLLTQYLTYPFSKEVRYQKDRESQPLIIYK